MTTREAYTIPRPRSFCVICDAGPGECAHHGLRYYDPLPYKRIEEDGETVGWQLPTWHGEAQDAHQLREQLRELERQGSSTPKPDPSRCSDCGAFLATYAVVNGYSLCSSCYRESKKA